MFRASSVFSFSKIVYKLTVYTVVVSFLLPSCSIFKTSDRKVIAVKEEALNNFKQNLTARYNVLYNSNLMLQEEERSIASSKKENYQIRLSVFDEPLALGDPHQGMDSLIQKAYKIVNDKQESKYVDEAYLIIGKANYMKGSYYTAIEFFNNLAKNTEYEAGFKSLAYAWRSRALLQIGKINEARSAVDSSFVFLDDTHSRTFANACMANYLIRTGQAIEAIPYLEFAIETTPDRGVLNRWRFLLAQLYLENNEVEASFQLFSRLAKSNVSYDMAFEAGLQAAYLEGRRTNVLEDRVRPFYRMLKEGKNSDYRDQILFQMGKIYLSEGRYDEAQKYFDSSLQEENASVYQSTETYLTIADFHFDHERYLLSQHYYDSVAMVLPQDYTDVDVLRRKLSFMSELTELYQDNLWQDTIIGLAMLNETERLARLEQFAESFMIQKKNELATQEKMMVASKRKRNTKTSINTVVNRFANVQPTDIQTDGRFYFNNMDAMMLGQSEFKRRWGGRQLKDNWRYSPDETQELTEVTKGIEKRSETEIREEFDEEAFLNYHRQRFVDALPTTKESYDSVYNIIHDNMIVIGNIYRDYTRDNHEAIIAYEQFLDRFPNTEAGAEVHYSLYRMYHDVNPSKSMQYRNRLIELYPSSLHALVARDPYYLDKVNREKETANRAFERIFNLYVAGDHRGVIAEVERELQTESDNMAVAAQISYLKALAIGRVERVENFTEELKRIIHTYPGDSLVTPIALENIAYIEENPDQFTNRVNALQDIDKSRMAFVDEPSMTPWPALRIHGDYRTGSATAQGLSTDRERKAIAHQQDEMELEEVVADEAKEEAAVEEELRKVGELATTAVGGDIGKNDGITVKVDINKQALNTGNLRIDFGPNDYRDKSLFPDSALYYFVIDVVDHRVNLAPSRYGVGQFIRSRYARAGISHHLKEVNGENQLLYIGPFKTYDDVKEYELRVLNMLPDIMKVPQDIYNTFVITLEMFDTLTDGVQIRNYHQAYLEQ